MAFVDANLPEGQATEAVKAAITELATNSLATTTAETYESHLGDWFTWCAEFELDPACLDVGQVLAHIASVGARVGPNGLARDGNGELLPPQLRPSSVSGRLSALNNYAERLGLPRPGQHPEVSRVIAGIRRTYGTHYVNRRDPATWDVIKSLVDACRTMRFEELRSLVALRLALASDASVRALMKVDTDEIRFSKSAAEVPVLVRDTTVLVRLEATGGTDCPVGTLRRLVDIVGSGPLFRSSRSGGALHHGTLSGFLTSARRSSDAEIGQLIGSLTKPTLAAVRDEALISTAYETAFRAMSMTALSWRDLKREGADWFVRARVVKGHRFADGHEVALYADGTDRCAADAMTRWYDAVCDEFGFDVLRDGGPAVFPMIHRDGSTMLLTAHDERPLGITGDAINDMVRRRAREAALPKDLNLGCHSFRAGLVTDALDSGVAIADVMGITGHLNTETVLIYHRRSRARKRSTAAKTMSAIKAVDRGGPVSVPLPQLPGS